MASPRPSADVKNMGQGEVKKRVEGHDNLMPVKVSHVVSPDEIYLQNASSLAQKKLERFTVFRIAVFHCTVRWPGGVWLRHWLGGCRFDCACCQAIQFGTSHRAMISYSWKDSHKSGFALAICHKLTVNALSSCLTEGDEHLTNTPHVCTFSLRCTPSALTTLNSYFSSGSRGDTAIILFENLYTIFVIIFVHYGGQC